jgi:hypothetical protein
LSAERPHERLKGGGNGHRNLAREIAATVEARPAEIRRVESAFEHGDLTKALAT